MKEFLRREKIGPTHDSASESPFAWETKPAGRTTGEPESSQALRCRLESNRAVLEPMRFTLIALRGVLPMARVAA